MKNKNTLLILTKKWGTNFTGATVATQNFAVNWIAHFPKMIVLTLEIGSPMSETFCENLEVRKCRNEFELAKMICDVKREERNKILGYSDDHLGFLFAKANIHYIHTYHGNWPDARWISFTFFVKSLYFIPLYKKTLRNADKVVNVSSYMQKFTKIYNSESVIIHNGINYKPPQKKESKSHTYVMVGNIDSRKYKLFIKIASLIYSLDPDIFIEIYGKEIDRNICAQLKKIPNIKLMGQQNKIPYADYCGLINTSTIENLAISVCEAIYSGIPVFCFNVGGLPEIVKDGETGKIFSINETEEMAKELVDYANSMHRIIINKAVLKSFDWSIAANEYLKLFYDIGERK